MVWVFDRSLDPQKSKMQVCVDYAEGWFMRINTRDRIRPCVPLPLVKNPFLKHDSHVECSINMIDEFEVEDALRMGGVIGRVSLEHAPEILAMMLQARFIPQRDKDRLALIFQPFC